MDIFSVLPKRLKDTREARGLTQAEAGDAVGKAQTYVSNLENGINRPGVLTLLSDLADLYEVSLDYIFGRTDNPIPHSEVRASSPASRSLLLSLASLPEHKRLEVAAFTDALVAREKSQYAYWTVVVCDDCGEDMAGAIAENGEVYYWHESDECSRQTIREKELDAAVMEATRRLTNELSRGDQETAKGGFVNSLHKFARDLGLIKKNSPVDIADVNALITEILSHKNRAIPHAWLSRHFQIRVANGKVETVKVM